MAVESIQIHYPNGHRENVQHDVGPGATIGASPVQVHQHPPVVYAGSSSVSIVGAPPPRPASPVETALAPAVQEAPPFIVFVDPDVFGDSAPDVVRWLTMAGLGLFAVGRSAGTVWPETLTHDQAALKNMFRRVQLLRANCKGQMGAAAAAAKLVKPPSDPPPKLKRKGAKGGR